MKESNEVVYVNNSKQIGTVIEKIVSEITADIKKEVKSRGFRAANELTNAVHKVLRGERSGRVYKVNGTYGKKKSKKGTGSGVYYTASAPGEAPAVRTGLLRLSFTRHAYAKAAGNNLEIHAITKSGLRVGKYALGELLENGTRKMAPRPFKEKIKELAMPKVEQIFNEPYVR